MLPGFLRSTKQVVPVRTDNHWVIIAVSILWAKFCYAQKVTILAVVKVRGRNMNIINDLIFSSSPTPWFKLITYHTSTARGAPAERPRIISLSQSDKELEIASSESPAELEEEWVTSYQAPYRPNCSIYAG